MSLPSSCKNTIWYSYYTRRRELGLEYCRLCGSTDNSKLTWEHCLAISRGGSRKSIKNLSLTCKRCNSKKGSDYVSVPTLEWIPPGYEEYPPEILMIGDNTIMGLITDIQFVRDGSLYVFKLDRTNAEAPMGEHFVSNQPLLLKV